MPTAILLAQKLSESANALIGRVDAQLVALGAIGMQDCLITRRVDAPGPRYSISLVYTVPGPVALRAAGFVGTPTSAADAQATAFLAANPTYRGHFVRDLGDQRRGRLDTDILMLIYATTPLTNCGYDRSKLIPVKALGNILAGATGSAQRVYQGGLAETITIVNRSTITWGINVYGYAFPRAGDCTFDGVPTCCP